MAAVGADQLGRILEELGVELVFGLPGVHNLPIWKSLSDSPIRLVGVRHEQAAVYAADGYARATGRLGVAVVTTGPGAANTLGATGEAMASGSPVLVIATDISTRLRRDGVYRGVLHETRDQAAMFAPVVKRARTLGSTDSVGEAVAELAGLAAAAPAGPVYLGVPTDLLSRPEADVVTVSPSAVAVKPDTTTLDAAAELLVQAKNPLIWAGGGSVWAGAGPLIGELATRLASPVLTTYASRGLIPDDHPCAVAGPVHAPEVGALWDEADVVLAIGTDFDGMMTQNWAMPLPPHLISINIDPAAAAANYTSSVTLVGDAAAVVGDLLARLPGGRSLGALKARLGAIGERIDRAVEADDREAQALIAAMDRVLPDETVVVADMCIPGYWLAGYRRFTLPRKLAYPVGWGTLGFAFPASLGSALAAVGPAVCVTGDGGFLFACGELATAVEAALNLTIVLVDDGGYGMLRFDQIHAGDEPFGVDLQRPDFAALAAAFGVGAQVVDGFGSSFEVALKDAVTAPGTQMIVVNAGLKPPVTTSPRWYRRQ